MNENENDNKKSIGVDKIIPIILITFIISSLFTMFIYYKYLDEKNVIVTSYNSNSSLEDKLNLIRKELENNYLNSDEINDTKLVDSALKGYVSGIGDEYTELMTAKEYKSLEEQLSEYVGIGIYVGQSKDGEAVILGAVGKDSPAYEVGIKTYDVIVKVEGEDVTGLSLDEVVSKIKGKEGTKVKVTMKRDNKELDFEVERRSIKVSEISSKMLENNIGYIDFGSFTEDAYNEFLEAYKELEKKGAKKLIIDLRDNTGGYVEIAEEIMDLFLNKGEVEYITVDNKKNEIVTTAKTDKVINMPVAIITNEYTASASEIFTGCMKDHKLATVIGTKSYGKGVIQTVKPILNGDAYLKVTVMKYVTPNKNEINKVGIKPDIELELDEKTLKNKLDNQIERAVKELNKK